MFRDRRFEFEPNHDPNFSEGRALAWYDAPGSIPGGDVLGFFLVERFQGQNSPSLPFYTLSYGCTDHQVRFVIRPDFTKKFGPVSGRTSDGIRQYKHLSKSSHVFDEKCLKWPKLEITKQKTSSHHELTGCKENIVEKLVQLILSKYDKLH